MGVCVNSGLGHAPDFTPHRVNVKAVDAAPPTVAAQGMVSAPFEDVWAQVSINGTTTGITIEVLYWSDLDAKFLSQSPQQQFTNLTSSKMIKFSPGGQRFFLMITGSFTGVTSINISCAGANPVIVESA